MKSTESKNTTKLVEALNLVLADSYALMVNTHNAHWNVEGPGFFALHTAFEEQYTNLFTAIDEIAERIRALGGYAMGSLPEFSDTARLDNLKAPMKEGDFVRALLKGNEKTVTDAKMVRDLAADQEDKETEDLMIERITYHEKTIWMLKSFLGG